MTQDFSGFGLPAKLLEALTRIPFTTPTPIQAKAIPLALAGRDLLASAQTGTGKTAAFGIPLVVRLMENPQLKALIMTPTRELAAQVEATLKQIIPPNEFHSTLLIGGESMHRQLRQLQRNPRLIIGTPGRINDHLSRGSLKLDRAGILVLDETDRMLDMGFGVQIDKIIQRLPAQRQTLLFSATLPAGIIKLSSKYLNDPERVSMGETHKPVANIQQEVVQMGEGEKYKELLVQLEKRKGSVIIFVKTKYGTERLATRLCREKHEADAIHGDLQQRRREKVIQGFRDKKYRILVATDVAARGLDIPHIEHVINYDLPQCPEDYIHRIGRTARAGAEGSALSFLVPGEDSKWRAIQRLLNPGSDTGPRGARMPERKGGPKNANGNRSKKRRFRPDAPGNGASKGGFSKSRKQGQRGRSFSGANSQG
jgi:superfamily II DNA/RNA helicase